MNLTIENLRHYIALADLQNINQTAKKLNISPSAISFSLSKIEDEVGEKLFNRVGKRIFLNSFGREFLIKSTKVLNEFANLDTIKNKRSKFKGHLRLGGSHWLASKVLAKACSTISREHSDLSFELRSMDTFSLATDILTGQLDFAICFNTDHRPGLSKEVLIEGELKMVVSKKHPLAKMKFKEWQKQINLYPYAAHKSGKLIERCDSHPMFSKFGIQPNISFLWDSDEVGLELLRVSDAWTLIPDIVAMNSKEFQCLELPKGWVAPFNISILYSSVTNQLDLIESFKKVIRKNFISHIY